MPDPQPSESTRVEKSLALIHALNEIATALQESILNEENVYSIFEKEVVSLGLRGGISELDEKGEVLYFRTVAYTNPFQKVLASFEKQLKMKAAGYSIKVDQVDVYTRVVRQGEAVFVSNTSQVSAQVVPRQLKGLVNPLLSFLGSPPGIFAPLVYNGKIMGMLNMVGPDLTCEDLPTLQAFANQITVALENSRLVQKLQAANTALEVAYQKTLEGWVKALDLRDNETEGHTVRVANATVQLAAMMGFSQQDLQSVRHGALLHDIGKMAIPDNILRKPGPLSAEEWMVMKQHPLLAYNWLKPIDYLQQAIDIPYCHHEHWDGSGYVQGLKEDEIPYPARVFSIIDVWDAMRSDRPYRKAIPEDEILAYLRQQSGKLFDPRVVEAFFDCYPTLIR